MKIGTKVKILESPFISDSLEYGIVGKTGVISSSQKMYGITVFEVEIDNPTEDQKTVLEDVNVLFHKDWLQNLQEEPNEESQTVS